jgi:pimeloyl-ACP methyl ester carboxylesterase
MGNSRSMNGTNNGDNLPPQQPPQHQKFVVGLTPQQRRSITRDLSGLCQLSTDAIHKTTQVVEAQHSRLDILSTVLFTDRGTDKVRNPIAAMIYDSIYNINSFVGNSLEYIVLQLEPLLESSQENYNGIPTTTTTPHRIEIVIAILNGIVGDYLHSQDNPLQIHMQWRSLSSDTINKDEDDDEVKGRQKQQTMQKTMQQRKKKHYLLLIHGSCASPHDWWQQGHNHGIALAAALRNNMEPLFLHYNTGLHISENGKLLSQCIQQLVNEVEEKDDSSSSDMIRISIIGHSMGGLVARSACYYATQQDGVSSSSWIQHLHHLITLGTPHHGAILEQGGKLVDSVLGAHRFTEPISWLTKIRSAGVLDLGYGNIRDEDWSYDRENYDNNEEDKENSQRKNRAAFIDNRQPTPLPSKVRCLAIAAVLGDANSSSNRLLGTLLRTDGLVTEASALGIGNSNNPELNLVFDTTSTIYNLGHLGLLSSQDVYRTILCFLET